LTGVVRLPSDPGPAILTAVFISVPVRQDQEQKSPYRDRLPTVGAIELGGFQFLKIFLLVLPVCGDALVKLKGIVVHEVVLESFHMAVFD